VIEAEHAISIDAAIDSVWGYVNDLQKGANLMPGCRDCTVINADDSRWTLKVGVGGLVRTVNVLVHVNQWDGPEQVSFSYKLEGDPVAGSGSYMASRKCAHETEVTLRVRVEGGGPLAPMWEAMCRPLLPRLIKLFAGHLKAEIEKTSGQPASQDAAATNPPSVLAGTGKWIRNL
jgi:carbon monoxide dehydrogenase subunit G